MACAALLLVSGPEPLLAAMHWAPVPRDVDMAHVREAARAFRLVDGAGASARMMQPDLAVQPIRLNDRGEAVIHPDGKEYFHVLIARRESPARVETAIRYFHLFGRPAGVSPERLTATRKGELEIVPDPLPREHWSYLSNHAFDFLLRFEGRPLANHPVDFISSNGSRLMLTSDASGRVRLRIPDDFHEVHPGFRHNRSAEFMLTLKHADRGKVYVTGLSAAYRTDPAHWQSLTGGIALACGGLLFGGLLGWRLKQRNQTGAKRKGAA